LIKNTIIFEHLIESMEEGVIFFDAENKLAFFNTSATKLIPIDFDKHIGNELLECHLPESHNKLLRIIKSFKADRHSNYQHVKFLKGKYYENQILAVRNEQKEYLGVMLLVRDVTKRVKLENRIKALAIKDGLTGLYNLRHFYQELERELARSRRKKTPYLSLLFFDIDNFKEYNDLYGHKEGDKVIKKVAEIAASSTRRDVDSVFRYGGDEFAVILPDTGKDDASIVANRLRETYVMENLHDTSLSVGVISYTHGMDVDTFVEKADQAMYLAKNAGGNKVYVFETQDNASPSS